MTNKRQIYIEDSLLYAEEFFSELGEITRFAGDKITAEELINADVLLTRSTTQVNEKLLKQADKLAFIGTATAGYDHIDGQYIESKGKFWTAAPGCNADAVADYVLSALFIIAGEHLFQIADKTIAVVGAGQVGSRLINRLSVLGCKVLAFDPVRASMDPDFESADFEDVLKADVISCHVPLTQDDIHPTKLMFGAEQLAKMKSDVIFVNACRGEIVDEEALYAHMQSNPQTKLVLDVFDNEPNIDTRILNLTTFASPHIAGHSLEGKARGTEMLYYSLCQFWGIQPVHQLHDFLPPMRVEQIDMAKTTTFEQSILRKIINLVYDIRDDNAWFKQAMKADPTQFKTLRRQYPIRREMTSLCVKHPVDAIQQQLNTLSLRS
ncbi:4-phosphoerythronate dehydrogenase [Algibacillus agarilyticus]|uniref:4-phosphoerythronate dehydrogenase n=1 Tax=Algibacillus agarilyticus TaxID=2234133 RepID=UPI0018E4E9AD|nr:4-phosphoerythronate dehydrogenase [Algibacillus agarilyticus]